jgi:hypothetical protein
MYCSEECRAIDLQKFHEFECTEVKKDHYDSSILEMKILCDMLYHFNWDVEAMKKFFDSHHGKKPSSTLT